MIKRFISIVLAVAMIAGLATIAASAEGNNTVKSYNYVALGDSIAAGYGLSAPGTANDPALVLSENLIANPVQDAYAQVFGKRLAEIGADYGYTTKATNLASTAYRAEDVSKTIKTQGYKGAVAAHIFESFVGNGASDLLIPYHDIYNKYLPDADMVSIQLGGNDIVMGVIYPMTQSDNPIMKDMATAVALLLFGQSAETAIGAGIKLIIRDKDQITPAHIAEVAQFFSNVVNNKEQLVLNAADNVEGVIDSVRDINYGVDIALIGMYNPYGNSLEYDGQVRDLCTVMQNIFVKAVDEAIDIDISVGDVEIVPAEEAEEKSEELKEISYELTDIVVDRNFFDEMRKARIKALLTIAANELAYPIQYLTAGKNVDPQMKLLNERLQEIAERKGATYVDVYDISNECNTDPHPTAAGHKEIADRLEAAMMDKIIEKMTSYTPEIIMGDLNGDGKVDITDATTLQRYLAGMSVPYLNLDAADVDGDGKVNARDLTMIQRSLVHM